jgi:hypothetical protein
MTLERRIGVGLLGTGVMGGVHARSLRALQELDPPLAPALVAPLGASIEDGYRACEVADAIARAATSGRKEHVAYREVKR